MKCDIVQGKAGIHSCVICLILICLYGYSGSAQEVVLTLEAEAAQLSGDVKVKSGNGFSGNRYVGDNHAGSQMIFEEVEVQEEGTYEFYMHYTGAKNRSVSVKSGYYPAVVCTAAEDTPEWDAPPTARVACYIYLNAGMNRIVVSPYQGDGPNIDKFEIALTTIELPRPVQEKKAWAYDLTDDAVSLLFNGEPAPAALTDNDEETVATYTATVASVQVECDVPYLLTAYYLSAGLYTLDDVDKWQLQYSVDGRKWQTLSPDAVQVYDAGTLFTLKRSAGNAAASAARHYRLIASGGVIGELQLFGIPYLSAQDGRHFPADLTEGVDIRNHTLGIPLGVYDYVNVDERYYNLFDRNMKKKYYWHSERTFTVDVELDAPAHLTAYTLTSCQDYPERDPKSWVLEGFDRDWEVVDEVHTFTFPARYATMKFHVDADKTYRGFRLRTTQNNGSESFQLLKWQLFGEKETSGLSGVPQSDGRPLCLVSGHELIIRCAGSVSYRVCDLSGCTVAAGTSGNGEYRCVLAPGVYVVYVSAVSGSSHAEKVVVR